MNCTVCGGRLSVTNTVTNGKQRTSRAVCMSCEAVHTLVAIAIPYTGKKDGYKTLSCRLREGTARVDLTEVAEVDEDQPEG